MQSTEPKGESAISEADFAAFDRVIGYFWQKKAATVVLAILQALRSKDRLSSQEGTLEFEEVDPEKVELIEIASGKKSKVHEGAILVVKLTSFKPSDTKIATSALPPEIAGESKKKTRLKWEDKFGSGTFQAGTIEEVLEFVTGRKSVEEENTLKASFNKELDALETELAKPAKNPIAWSHLIAIHCMSAWLSYTVGCIEEAPGFSARDSIPEKLKNLFEKAVTRTHDLAAASSDPDEIIACQQELIKINEQMMEFPKQGLFVSRKVWRTLMP